MPNDCYNYLTITTDSPEELNDIIRNEFQHESNADNEYVYNETVKVQQRGSRGIRLRLWTAWSPEFEWLEGLLDKYPFIWIKNEWEEEGGMAGVWIGKLFEGEKDIKHLEWLDLCIEAKHYLFTESNEV